MSESNLTSFPLFELVKIHRETKKPPLDLFLDYLDQKKLTLYSAQEEAILELGSNKNIILNTPTGSGKSLVAHFLQFQSLCEGKRSIYTCPIKALVNEKFLSLCHEFGPDQVGMMTGDASVNIGAPLICCTAEILSNLSLRLGKETPFTDVIMDEFHYYSDRERGNAWQIPLLTLPRARFLLMSATLGNTKFFEEAITKLTGNETLTIKSEDRPVPLNFEYSEKPLQLKILDLIEKKLYPLYLVNFTQRECAEVAQNLMSIDFCTKEEKKLIAEELIQIDFRSPYGKEVQKFIKHGLGIHHAGLLPRYRILVEKLAKKGLLKIIIGTDTLGVGINVPIRTVLFTKLCKYDGEKTTLLSIRDFKQIAGRAGRRGYDTAGTVVVQAPEHVIENKSLEEKAAGDAKKAKKLVKRKPPEKGFLPWNDETMKKMIEGEPEPLQSRFKVDHGMVLNVLSRPHTKNCKPLRNLVRASHETPHQKKRHLKHAFALFRSLHERSIITLNPLQVHVDLQEDFSIHHGLALFLIDTLELLDTNSETYALDLLTLVESILENPELILRRQLDRLKTIRMEELKASGMEYDERIAELEKMEYPKPNRDFIYSNFNEFARVHPWLDTDAIRPKSIAREMFELYQSFPEYIREYGLERVEGLLLRYLTETYKVLVQTVPDRFKTEEVHTLIEYFGEILETVDSSLIQEWEKIRAGTDTVNKPSPDQAVLDAIEVEKQRIKLRNSKIKNEIFKVLRTFRNRDYEEASLLLSIPASELELKINEYLKDHTEILIDQKARSPHYTNLKEEGEKILTEQVLSDPDNHQDWSLKLEFDQNLKIKFLSLGQT